MSVHDPILSAVAFLLSDDGTLLDKGSRGMFSQSQHDLIRFVSCALIALAAGSVAPSRVSAGCVGHNTPVGERAMELSRLEVLNPADVPPTELPGLPSSCGGPNCSGRDTPIQLPSLKKTVGVDPGLVIPGFAIVFDAERISPLAHDPRRSQRHGCRIDRPPRFLNESSRATFR